MSHRRRLLSNINVEHVHSRLRVSWYVSPGGIIDSASAGLTASGTSRAVRGVLQQAMCGMMIELVTTLNAIKHALSVGQVVSRA